MTNPLEGSTKNPEPKLPGRHSDLAGLNRRELFAAMAMQGACSIGIPSENLMMANIRQCVKLADCLIRVLDEPPVLDQE